MSAVIVLVAFRHAQPTDVLKRHAEQKPHGNQQRGDLYVAVDLAVVKIGRQVKKQKSNQTYLRLPVDICIRARKMDDSRNGAKHVVSRVEGTPGSGNLRTLDS